MEVVAVNDIVSIENTAYLLKYDTVYGTYDKEVTHKENALVVDGQEIRYSSIRNPEELPWKEYQVDVVIESTGVFTTGEDAERHLKAGAKTVVISAPTKSVDTPNRGSWSKF